VEFGQHVELREHDVTIRVFKKQGAFQKGKASFRDTVLVHSKPALCLTFGSMNFLAGFFLGELEIHGLVREMVMEGQFYIACLVYDGRAKIFVCFAYDQFGVGAK